ncbi:ester cyclase [Nocardia sp. NRRL WC-3656]|uniref:ester cyclase n=1 Tax=Nocardia sp. NRRL WC-3656 TaxID=1463824 RepID=UPI0004C3215E|nr:ester cyclase [Nocardia sp. NRRL WC-3656]
MTTNDAGAVVLRMLNCFNTRQFDEADDLHTPDCFSHPLGTTGFEAGKSAWRSLVALFPDIRVVAEDVLVDGDKVAVRSTVEGVPVPDDDPKPTMIEIFRIADGRIAENWGVGQGLSYSAETL